MPRVAVSLRDICQLPKTHEATIPESYLDDMGHMNVMWYTHLFSLGMGGLFKIVGMPWERLAETNDGTFALESHVRYLSEVRVGQAVEVYTRIVGRTEKRLHALHFMINRDTQQLSATFENVLAFVDLEVRKMAPFPDAIAGEIDRLLEQHTSLLWPPPLCGSMKP